MRETTRHIVDIFQEDFSLLTSTAHGFGRMQNHDRDLFLGIMKHIFFLRFDSSVAFVKKKQ